MYNFPDLLSMVNPQDRGYNNVHELISSIFHQTKVTDESSIS